MITKLTRYICLLYHDEFSQSINAVYVFYCARVCFPVFSSISLDLLPERTATLMVYEEVVEIVSGLQGELSISMSSFASSGSITPQCTFEKRTMTLNHLL